MVDYQRKKIKQATALDESLVSRDSNLQLLAEHKLDIEQLVLATKRLTEAQREVISLRFAGELSIAQVAKVMGKSQEAVKALQHSAIVALRKALLMAEDNEKSKEFNNVLNECLERLLVKGETMEQCLRSYPEQADPNMAKAELYTRLVDKRVAEIVYMADKGDARQIEVITQRLDKHLAMLTSLAIAQRGEERALKGPPALEPLPPPAEKHAYPYAEVVIPDIVEIDRMAKLGILLERYAINHPAALQAALEEAPELARLPA